MQTRYKRVTMKVLVDGDNNRVVTFYADFDQYDPFVTPYRVWVPRRDKGASDNEGVNSNQFWDVVPGHLVPNIQIMDCDAKTAAAYIAKGEAIGIIADQLVAVDK